MSKWGAKAEEFVATVYNVEKDSGTASWYDCVSDLGTKYEVKATLKERGSDIGRYRVWADQHRSLVASDNAGTAWYVFVLLDGNRRVLDHIRCKPSTVTKWVNDNGGWGPSGHTDRRSRQCEIPWNYVH